MPAVLPMTASFDGWAEVYDSQPNPLLALEQRVLTPLLPPVRGLDVLDAGCGTGRWLMHLAEGSPRRLTGVDLSSEMIAAAGRKLGSRCELRLGSCTSLPVPAESTDLVLSSFVLSYLDDLEAFAVEVDRILRPGGSFVLTDMHPETESSLGWKRSYHSDGAEVLIRSYHYGLPHILEIFERHGFRLMARDEPQFGAEEQAIFAKHGKEKFWAAAQGWPAIYVLKWRKPPTRPRTREVARHSAAVRTGLLALHGARYATGPESTETLPVRIEGGRIQGPETRYRNPFAEVNLDLSGYLLLPGLINAHDHLEFGLFPRLGNGPYRNATEWAHDIQAAHKDTIHRLRRVPHDVGIAWGALRNLLSGATTVCHHNPISPQMTTPGFPVRVVTDFAWAHSCAFDPQLASKFANSNPNLPFIVHAAEGVDSQSAKEVFLLDEMRALDGRTLLVHGLACSAESVALINQRFATVILCPTSNEFLFHRSPALRWVRSVHSIILGSDSPLTAAGDLLDEIDFAHHHIQIDAVTLYRMVTTQAARSLRLQRGEGTLSPGAVADVLVVRDIGLTPAEVLVQTKMEQLELVILGGQVQLASEDLMRRLPSPLVDQLEPLEVEGHTRWLRAPVRSLLKTTQELLGEAITLGGKRVGHVPAA
jgi:ubiquinone/menaquinone biosynthesis C-methylase UbiE/cytosine/adenosine deaminase-related metal-dependent hydrolase